MIEFSARSPGNVTVTTNGLMDQGSLQPAKTTYSQSAEGMRVALSPMAEFALAIAVIIGVPTAIETDRASGGCGLVAQWGRQRAAATATFGAK